MFGTGEHAFPATWTLIVTEDFAFHHVGLAFVHMQVRAEDVSARDFHQRSAGLSLFASGALARRGVRRKPMLPYRYLLSRPTFAVFKSAWPPLSCDQGIPAPTENIAANAS